MSRIHHANILQTGFAAALLLFSGLAGAQVYKCEKDGVTTYQEVPCNGAGATLDIPLSTPPRPEVAEPVEQGVADPEAGTPPPERKSLTKEEIDAIAEAVEQRRLDSELEAARADEAALANEAPQEEPAIASCRGIRIYSAVAYDVGGQTFLRRWRHDGRYRRRFVDIAQTQCASIVVKLPGYYGDIFESMEDTFARRFVATFADDTIRVGESVELPHGRVDSTAKYRIRVCFGEGEIPIIAVDCE